ncbi:hypothetical protein J3A78_002368 [Streptomyces sp. PvR006]|uniref:GIY-YIG nuclease family protein n=1 Tax=Streptomyces sp. PvR006 TaxID=2817860 RepID=UPI001AE4C618|nr:GIY-YIG nuclease family protein [Streptomyces sp. PvR006]MBP2581890.1 hypothetical protein [Streptomyces sp. PvR006]
MALSLVRPDGMKTALYRLFDADGALLYVGIANNPRTRWSSHAGEKRWWGDVSRKTLEWFATREEAESAEVAAIVGERPRYNVTHSETRRPGDAREDNTERYRYLVKFRVLTSEWARFGQATKAAGTNRSAVLLQLMAWYMRKPGAQCPARPPAGPWSGTQEEIAVQSTRRTVPAPRTSRMPIERAAEIDEAAAEFKRARLALEAVVREARNAGMSLTAIAEHSGFSREWVRKIIGSKSFRATA